MINLVFVDDDQASLVLYEEICNKEGFRYTGIRNPLDIGKLMPGLHDISIIFVDLEMPRMDGFQVLSALRLKSELQSVSIVASTVHSAKIDQARAAGFDGYITKPLNIDKFAHSVRAILNGEQVWELYSD